MLANNYNKLDLPHNVNQSTSNSPTLADKTALGCNISDVILVAMFYPKGKGKGECQIRFRNKKLNTSFSEVGQKLGNRVITSQFYYIFHKNMFRFFIKPHYHVKKGRFGFDSKI